MNVEKVESLLERSRPAPPPPDLRRRIVEAAAVKVRIASPSRKPRFVEVMTVAASILMLLGTVTWLLRETPPVPGQAGGQGQPFEERRLVELQVGESVSDLVWSADGKHWACVTPAAQSGFTPVSVIIDGRKDPGYSEIRSFRFGADGTFAYIGHDPTRGFVLVVNSGIQHEFDAYEQLAWSPDGKRLAFTATSGGQSFVVVDGKRSQAYDGVWDLMWSPDGRTIAYSARLGQDWFVVVDGKKGEPFDGVRNLTFSADGKSFAYAANEGKWMMVVGEAKGEEFEQVGVPIFSPDGKRFSYTALKGERTVVIVGPGRQVYRNELPPASDQAGPAVFSRDGKVWAYRAVVGADPHEFVRIGSGFLEGEELVCSEKAGAFFEAVGDPVINPDGTLVAYAASKGSRKYLVVGDKTLMKLSLIDRISFGPDGRTLAFRGGQYNKQFVVAGNSRGEEVDEVISGPVWSSDGKKVAYTARTGTSLWSKVLEVK